ncbi:MAG: phosphotransferase family protein [Anaerolineae bacterium]
MNEALTGGRDNQIFRSGETVIRPSGAWSGAVFQLLEHLQKSGFEQAPQPLGFDENGNEIVSFISGEVSNYPLSDTAKSEEALISAAKLLRAYHDTTASFINAETLILPWMLPSREPAEVICHGDFAPYNVVLNGNQAIGIIDFDTAHPAPRLWDIAYAVYRWAPLSDQHHAFIPNLVDQIRRTKLFCDSYNMPDSDRKELVQMVLNRMIAFVDFMQAEAENGNEKFIGDLRDGHHLIYLKDIDYLVKNQAQITLGLF